MPPRARRWLLVAICVVLPAPAGARGDEPSASGPHAPSVEARQAQAASLYQDGIKHYNLGQYDRAIALFTKAYLLTEAPELLSDIAQAYRLEGPSGCVQSLAFYRSYLRADPRSSKR